MAGEAKSQKMTVFRSDRHEDWASMILVALVVVSILVYMAYIVTGVKLTAPAEGKVLAVKVAAGAQIKKGDPLYVLEMKEKKFVKGALEEKVVQKEIKASIGGKVTAVVAKVGDTLGKGKPVLILEHEKGSLP